jgi:hypothetical protein
MVEMVTIREINVNDTRRPCTRFNKQHKSRADSDSTSPSVAFLSRIHRQS